MNEWNTLDEAAAWLKQETGDEWTRHRVLSAALAQSKKRVAWPFETLLSLALPGGTLTDDADGKIAVPLEPVRAPLRQRHIENLIASGIADFEIAYDERPGKPMLWVKAQRLDAEPPPVCFTPRLRIDSAAICIGAKQLDNLLRFVTKDSPRPSLPSASTDEMATWWAPVTVAALEVMFGAYGQWESWGKYAHENGLSAARVHKGRGKRPALYSPYLASEWFLRRGVAEWDQRRTYRVLADCLLPEYQDKRDDLLLSAADPL